MNNCIVLHLFARKLAYWNQCKSRETSPDASASAEKHSRKKETGGLCDIQGPPFVFRLFPEKPDQILPAFPVLRFIPGNRCPVKSCCLARLSLSCFLFSFRFCFFQKRLDLLFPKQEQPDGSIDRSLQDCCQRGVAPARPGNDG